MQGRIAGNDCTAELPFFGMLDQTFLPRVVDDVEADPGKSIAFALFGSQDVIVGLMRDGFKVAFRDDGPPAAPIAHSERFMLVDGDLHLRGAYLASDEDAMAALVADAATLAAATPR